MIRAYASYGAITTKIRAMYGKRLRDKDWEALSQMDSVDAVAAYLRKTPGWQEAVSQLPLGPVYRWDLESALRRRVTEEYLRLYKFTNMADKRTLLFTVRRFEYEAILARLRGLFSDIQRQVLTEDIFRFAREKSKIDFTALEVAGSWWDVVNAVQDTIYYQPLLSIQTSGEHVLPNYTTVSVILQGVYLEAFYKYVGAHYKGAVRKTFLTALGEEADLYNLMHVMRLKRYFPASPQLNKQILLPVHHKLKPVFFEELMASPSEQKSFELIESSYYGKFFRENHFEYLDYYLPKRIGDFNRRQLTAGVPSSYIPTAYLVMLEQEMRQLFSAVERAFYTGVDRRRPPA